MGDVYVFYPELVNINETWEVPAVILEPNGYLIKDNHILSRGIPFVGSPYLVYPLAVFDEANPYSGNFVLPEPLRRTRKGAIYSLSMLGKWDGQPELQATICLSMFSVLM